MRSKLQDHFGYPPRLFDLERAAAYVALGKTKFLEMIEKRRMPKPVDLDGSPRWDRFELDAAIDDLRDGRNDPVKRGEEEALRRLRAVPDDDEED